MNQVEVVSEQQRGRVHERQPNFGPLPILPGRKRASGPDDAELVTSLLFIESFPAGNLFGQDGDVISRVSRPFAEKIIVVNSRTADKRQKRVSHEQDPRLVAISARGLE